MDFDGSDGDENPFDFVAQYKKLRMERKKTVLLTHADDKHQLIVNSTTKLQATSVYVTQNSSTQPESSLINSDVNITVDSTASTSYKTNGHGRRRRHLRSSDVNITVDSTASTSDKTNGHGRRRCRSRSSDVNITVDLTVSTSDKTNGHGRRRHLRSSDVNITVGSTVSTSDKTNGHGRRRRHLRSSDVNITVGSTVSTSDKTYGHDRRRRRSRSSDVNIAVGSTVSTSDKTYGHDRRRRRRSIRRRNCATEESINVIGPVISIGDFYDGYDMPLPKESEEKTSDDQMIENAGNIIDDWKKKQIEEAETEDVLAVANRVMNVKVYWRQMRTYCFPLRMSISSIYQHFAKLEDIDPTHVRLDLHKKTLSPTDTPNSINYKIVDFIDGEIEFYRSPYDTPEVVPKIEEPQDDVVKFCIKQKDVKKPIFVEMKKTDKMVILYIKLSEILGFDIDSFTLEFDGDKIKKSDTMESLDLEGNECFELFQKKSK